MKPPNAGIGRKKGVPNRKTVAVKEAIELAFDKLGGVKALVAWAQKDDVNRGIFYRHIWPKLLPLSVSVTQPPPAATPLSNPNVLAAALALDEAVDALSDPDLPGTVHAPAAPLGEVPPRPSSEPAQAVHEATPTPEREAVPQTDGDDSPSAR